MDINWRSTIDEAQSGNWCKSIVGEDKRTTENKQGIWTKAIDERVQRCFCMDIHRSERDSTRTNTTQNWVGHCSTTGTSGQVYIKSKLCYNNQTRYRQVVNNYIYSIYGRGYMVVTHSSSTQEKWQMEILYRF